MPRKPRCECRICPLCLKRDLQRKARLRKMIDEIVWPSWAHEARYEAEQLLAYHCPLEATNQRRFFLPPRQTARKAGAE